MSTQRRQPHVLIFPFMAQGHTLPLLDLSKALLRKNIRVTIITTPSNAKLIIQHLPNSPIIHVIEIPFPSNGYGLPKGCENTSQLPSMDLHFAFLNATKQLQKPFEDVLALMSASDAGIPLCVISDFFLGWTLESCQAFGVPRLVFHGMSVLAMAISKSLCQHLPHLKPSASQNPSSLDLPGMKIPFDLAISDVPEPIRNLDLNDPACQFLCELAEADVSSWGVVVNSFEELERSHISSFESFYHNGAKAWCVGPLFLCDDDKKPGDCEKLSDCNLAKHGTSAMQWLNEQVTLASVLYVSFGTQADVADTQLDEIAFALKESGVPFIWVVRSTTWCVPKDVEEGMKSGKGLIVREWVDQRQILGHKSIGGFLSHCGWNSVLESISVGVPILAWPMIAEQPLNAKLVVTGLGAGIGVCVPREEVCDGVRELMVGERGRRARERAQALGRQARRAVKEGGSSHETLNKLIDQLCGVSDVPLKLCLRAVRYEMESEHFSMHQT
ncbi:hypothetical protein BT93_L3399 [Corymbia citriodora subsp. variegata]|uniref:Glycosyltransferase n=1 Tax=Corymbia citriodora subsp. variegata TaxID=360336 RepID=A0A8T0CH92_CORYI|nr:hypothetical protein BT93_L3399 [Corymbia citriodora subsp. variegata]